MILIDLDLRKPKVHKIYNSSNDMGVSEILSEKVNLDKAIKSKDLNLMLLQLVKKQRQ